MQKQYILFAHQKGLGLFKQITVQQYQLQSGQFKLKDILYFNFDAFLADFQNQILPYYIVEFLARNLPNQNFQLLINEFDLLQLIKNYLPLKSIYNECQYWKFDFIEQIQTFTKKQTELVVVSKNQHLQDFSCKLQLIELMNIEIMKTINQLVQLTKTETHLILNEVEFLKQTLQNCKIAQLNQEIQQLKLLSKTTLNMIEYLNYILCNQNQSITDNKPTIQQSPLQYLIGAEKALFKALMKKHPDFYEKNQKIGKIRRVLAKKFGNENK